MTAPSDIHGHLEGIGQSDAYLRMQEQVSRAARTDRPVILLGERGTGKELAAARLHLLSGRWNQPYIAFNCSSLTETLIESELFGHEAGAFTGALRQRKGRFEAAHEGTLFLDEIATLPMTAQEKILRVVEYGQMERVGSSRSILVDTRLVAAANVDLRALSRAGRFRQDLLDRLSFEVIVVPPLRERRADIPLLASHFARRMAAELQLGFTPQFSPEAMKKLETHHWPGNIREIKNAAERAVYRTPQPVIETVDLDPFADLPPMLPVASPEPAAPGSPPTPADPLAALPLPEAIRQLELTRLRDALEQSRHNQRDAARIMGLTYDQFRGLYRKHRVALAPAS